MRASTWPASGGELVTTNVAAECWRRAYPGGGAAGSWVLTLPSGATSTTVPKGSDVSRLETASAIGSSCMLGPVSGKFQPLALPNAAFGSPLHQALHRERGDK